MATRIDPTQMVLELERTLGDLRKRLKVTKNDKIADELREKILKAEQRLLEAKEAELDIANEAINRGRAADRQLLNAKQKTSRAYEKQARQASRAAQQQERRQAQEAREGSTFDQGGAYPRRMPRGRLRRGAVGAAAAQGFQQRGVGGAFDATTDTLFELGIGAAASGKGKAAVGGAVVAALAASSKVIKNLGVAADEMRRTMGAQLVELSSPRFRQFGSSTFAKGGRLDISAALSSKDYEKDYLNEITALAEAQKEAIATGIKNGFDATEIDSLKNIVGAIGAATGESFQKGIGKFFGEEGIVQQIARMSSEGMGTIEHIKDKYIIAVKQYGMAPEVALKSIRSVAQEARTISLANILEAGAEASNKNVVLMEDFTDAVEEARTEVRSLVATEQGLAKVMGVGLRLANKTTLSYLQKLKGAKDLTRGLTSGFSESFGTLTAQRDVDYLIQEQKSRVEALKKAGAPKEEIQLAEEKLERATFLKSQNLLPNQLARMLSEAGFDQDLAALRLKDILTTGKGSLELKQMFQRDEISYEQLRIISELEKQVAAGKNVDEVIKQYFKEQGPIGAKGAAKDIAIRGEETFRGRQEAIVQQRVGMKDLAMYKQYAEDSAKFFAAVSGGTSIFNSVNSAVATTVGIINNNLNTSFDSLAEATNKAVTSINTSYSAPTTAVPTTPLPPALGSSPGASSVDAVGNITLVIPARTLQQAMQVNSSNANSTGTTP